MAVTMAHDTAAMAVAATAAGARADPAVPVPATANVAPSAMAQPLVRTRPRTEADLVSHFNIRELNSFQRGGFGFGLGRTSSRGKRGGRGGRRGAAGSATPGGPAEWSSALGRLVARTTLNGGSPSGGPLLPDGRGVLRAATSPVVGSPLTSPSRHAPFGTPPRPAAFGTPTRHSSARHTPVRAAGATSSAFALEPDLEQFNINPYGSFLSANATAKLLAAVPAPTTIASPKTGKLRRSNRSRRPPAAALAGVANAAPGKATPGIAAPAPAGKARRAKRSQKVHASRYRRSAARDHDGHGALEAPAPQALAQPETAPDVAVIYHESPKPPPGGRRHGRRTRRRSPRPDGGRIAPAASRAGVRSKGAGLGRGRQHGRQGRDDHTAHADLAATPPRQPVVRRRFSPPPVAGPDVLTQPKPWHPPQDAGPDGRPPVP